MCGRRFRFRDEEVSSSCWRRWPGGRSRAKVFRRRRWRAGNLEPGRAGFMPEKIARHHQERLAIIYIRQSTPQQVERNQESTKLQYALVDRAFQFGWTRETIVTIDDDLGRSGSTIEGRLGFQRLVAEVGLGHVGLV